MVGLGGWPWDFSHLDMCCFKVAFLVRQLWCLEATSTLAGAEKRNYSMVLKVRESDSRGGYWLWYGSGECSTSSKKGNKTPTKPCKKNLECSVIFWFLSVNQDFRVCKQIKKSEFLDLPICSVSSSWVHMFLHFWKLTSLNHSQKKSWKKQKKNHGPLSWHMGFQGFSTPWVN